MKTKAITLMFLLAMLSYEVQSQEVIDTVVVRASYEFLSKTKLDQEEYSKSDLMYLDIGDNLSKFYSRYQQLRDSVTREAIKQKKTIFEIRELRSGYKKGDNNTYYQYFKLNKSRRVSVIQTYGYICDEELIMPQWNIEDGVKTIAGYSCNKATTRFLGREWTVYFTPEIPINQGPWMLWGLPGLIVHAEDQDQLFQFSLTGFQLIDTHESIVFINTRSNGAKYETISKQNLVKYEKVFYDDFFAFTELRSGSPVTRPGGEPVPTVSVPYIPLEPW